MHITGRVRTKYYYFCIILDLLSLDHPDLPQKDIHSSFTYDRLLIMNRVRSETVVLAVVENEDS